MNMLNFMEKFYDITEKIDNLYFIESLFTTHCVIREWTVCSHCMLGRTFYVTFIPVTVCECHIELKATWLDLTW